MVGLLPVTGILLALHEEHGVSGVFERAVAAFEDEVRTRGYVDSSGEVCLADLDYRLLVAKSRV